MLKPLYIALCLLLIPTSCMKLTPDPETKRLENLPKEWDFLSRSLEEIPSDPLTLEDIVRLALEQNLDLLVRARQAEYQFEVVTGSRLKMLPVLAFSSEVSGRTTNTGMSSTSLEPSVPPAPPSISQEQHVCRYDFTLTYNLLDFGISYLKARQEANKSIMRIAEYQRATQTLITNVVTQYWKARVAKEGIEQTKESLGLSNWFLDNLDVQIEDQIMSKEIALQYQAMLLRIQAQYQLYEKNYQDAIFQLARLMGFPDACFELADEDFPDYTFCLPDPCMLAELALENRPEMFGLDAEERIKIQEAYTSLLQALPALAPFTSYNYDSNLYLIYNRWMVGGLRIAWNLLASPTNLQMMFANMTDASVTRLSKLAMSVAIVTQLNLAYINYYDSRQQYEVAKRLSTVREALYQTWETKWEVGDLSSLDLLATYRLEALTAKVDELKALGDVQMAIEQLNNALGIPFYFSYLNPVENQDVSINEDN